MGIKPSIGNNPPKVEILWGTAGQVIKVLWGNSNLKDFIGYLHYYGLLWLE